jgi:hypothetical protein
VITADTSVLARSAPSPSTTMVVRLKGSNV